MNDGIALVIGFKLKSLATVPMRLHLIRKEGLNLDNPGLHHLNHLVVIQPVVGQQVEQPHGARFADVQIL